MPFLLICVRNHDTLFNFAVFSRANALVQFDESGIGIALRHDPCTNSGQYFVIRRIKMILDSKSLENDFRTTGGLDHDDLCFCPNKKQRRPSCQDCIDKVTTFTKKHHVVVVHQLSYLQLDIELKLSLMFPSNLAHCCFNELMHSSVFRRRFLKYIQRRSAGRWKEGWYPVCECEEVNALCEYTLNVPRLLEILVHQAPANVCLAWCYRVEGLVSKRMQLEETMAWLSTLGGGYSSLGDYFIQFSEKAAKTSVTQLKIAIEMGDPIMASKCRLFFALSRMQHGKLRQSKKLIRNEFQLATSYKHRDQKLVDMCHGMWSKLQYLYSQRKRGRLSITSSKQNTPTPLNGYPAGKQTPQSPQSG